MSNIKLEPNKVLLEPETATSAFNSEHRKYERKSVAIVRGERLNYGNVKTGDKVIYDDSNSIDFRLDGTDYSIVRPGDIVAVIEEGE